MGNTKSGAVTKPLAIIAVARRLQVQRYQIIVLRDTLARFADPDGWVSHCDYLQSLEIANLSSPDTLKIFNLLFTMWDSHGNDKIPYRQFTLGLAPLACPNDDTASVARFLLHVYGETSKVVCPHKLYDLLNTINMSASHFGDNTLTHDELMAIVKFTFAKSENPVSPKVCTERVAMNRYVNRFISGKARIRVRFREQLFEVMEIPRIQDEDAPEYPPSPIAAVGSMLKTSFSSFNWDTDTMYYDCSSPRNSSKHMLSSKSPSLFDSVETWENEVSNFGERKDRRDDDRDGSETSTIRLDSMKGSRDLPDKRRMEV